MADDAIVFACANPVPEIWPWEAEAAGARIVATGRSDFPNQVNNSLGFPGIFRGALDVRARTITDEMCIAAAEALAGAAPDGGMDPECILPTMVEWEVYAREAVAVGMKAQEQGIARLSCSAEDELFRQAADMILRSRRLTEVMMADRVDRRTAGGLELGSWQRGAHHVRPHHHRRRAGGADGGRLCHPQAAELPAGQP